MAKTKKPTTSQKERKALKTIRARVPDQLYLQMKNLVKDGWFRDQEDVINQALRRFLDSHRPELMEKAIRDDVDWGLHGKS